MTDLIKLGRKLKLETFGPQTFSDILARICFAHRMDQHVTQDQLAEKANVSPKIIHRIEGGSSVEIADFEKIMNALRVTHTDIGHSIIFLAEEEKKI